MRRIRCRSSAAPGAAPGSDRGAKPKYCDNPDHNPLSAHRERRRREAEAKGQRAEETGGQPVTLGITRAAELAAALEKLTKQHADTFTRALTELREVGDIESAEAEVYAARTGADQRIATAENRLAEEIQRRRDAESERDADRADREQADDAAAQATARMEQLERELAELRAATQTEVRQVRESAAAEVRQTRESADRDISAARTDARQPARSPTPITVPRRPSRTLYAPARPRPPPSSALSMPRPPHPPRPPASARTTSTRLTSSPPPPAPG